MWGERSTVHLLIVVGSGMGPATRAPVLRAVSTISEHRFVQQLVVV